VKKIIVLAFFSFLTQHLVLAQGFTRQTFHDAAKKNIKEIYQVKDTIRNVLHGRYISYFLNGNVDSKGNFSNNETNGVWEFFYESGNLKMRGILKQNSNYGLWEYFYESGQKSMEGNINGRNREGVWTMYYENGKVKESGEYKGNRRNGVWKSYYEDGTTLRGEISYSDDFGRYTEYDPAGKVLSEGPKMGARQVGHWRFYSAQDGTLESEGDFENSKRNGEWINYYPSGKIASKGKYENDVASGKWEYFFEDGKISSTGEYLGGQRQGYWSAFSSTGQKESDATYVSGTGEYREYYKSGKLKAKGMIVDDHRQGHWEYYYETGKKEGESDYDKGKGTYFGYYPDGTLQTKGQVEDDKRVGTWEIYERDGKLSGYYKPFYSEKSLGNEVAELSRNEATTRKVRGNRFDYFDVRSSEFRGVILAGNPVLMFAGKFPVGAEFYSEERLGHEFEFIGIRDPFFQADSKVATDKQFERGYEIAIKQKFYNKERVGMWYFGHEVRFTNLGHFVNVVTPLSPDNKITISASDQRIQYGILLGYRIMQRNDAKGFTIDMFVSGDIGYRAVDMRKQYEVNFSNVSQAKFVSSAHVGLNIGHVFSNK
jgi:uncharacterized protein